MCHLIIKPIPVPKTGAIQKLKLNIAPGQANVYVHQTRWPRQKQNPNWRIEVTDIDGRHDEDTQKRIREACEQIARLYLSRWLVRQAPLMTLETVSWQELVKFATRRRYTVPSPYQQRRMRGRGSAKYPVKSEIFYAGKTPAEDDEVE